LPARVPLTSSASLFAVTDIILVVIISSYQWQESAKR
jgi:hypothetical protein